MGLQVGDAVPAFTAESTAGPVNCASLGSRGTVLYFYPRNDTPGCTAEALQFRHRHDDFVQAGFAVLGVSRDSLTSHRRFKSKLELPFDLISDPDERLCEAFDVIRSKVMYGRPVRGVERSTFVMDGNGRLACAWRGVKVPGHADEVLSFVRTLS